APVLDSLIEEGLPVVRLLVDGPRVELAIGAGRYSTIGRAAGRAARVVALHAPAGIERVDVTIVDSYQPQITYRFSDLAALRGWWAGSVSPEQLQPTLSADYADASGFRELRE